LVNNFSTIFKKQRFICRKRTPACGFFLYFKILILNMVSVGIDDMAFYAPKIYLDISELATARQIAVEKLRDGLGLHKMALPDAHEDAATMAAEVIYELITRNNIDPNTIGRIYLGTESALDMAKPTATYAMGMVQERLKGKYGNDCFRHCDVLDMTFACIAATDALLNTLDWVAAQPNRIGIVIASDIAKYELESSGEYTQGAGAVALLVKSNPRLLKIKPVVGIATESVHDFYKPRREIFTETPVFDGQYSNQCYQDRMTEALQHFRVQAEHSGLMKPEQNPALSERWARMIFHLPYAFHAKRMFTEPFIAERKAKGAWDGDVKKYGFKEPVRSDFEDQKSFSKAQAGFVKSVSESTLYKQFVAQKLEKAQRASSEMGNLYTASVFLALMSTLESDLTEGIELAGKRFGFVAYGSGSKAKVFEATVAAEWRAVTTHFEVFKKINDRKAISYQIYHDLHTGTQSLAYAPVKGRWGLTAVGTEGVTIGARYYGMI
jgi:hydroxymethylglutaryl-CoA synthase